MVLTDSDKYKIKYIEKEVCKYFKVDYNEIIKFNSTRDVSIARSFIFYIVHKDLGISLRCMMDVFSRKYRTITTSVAKTKYLIENLSSYNNVYNSIKKKIPFL